MQSLTVGARGATTPADPSLPWWGTLDLKLNLGPKIDLPILASVIKYHLIPNSLFFNWDCHNLNRKPKKCHMTFCHQRYLLMKVTYFSEYCREEIVVLLATVFISLFDQLALEVCIHISLFLSLLFYDF